MDTNEQTNSLNNSSALGDISILTPSQRREQERLRKEQEEKEAAKREKRRAAQQQRKEKNKRENKYAIFAVVIGIIGFLLIALDLFLSNSLLIILGALCLIASFICMKIIDTI